MTGLPGSLSIALSLVGSIWLVGVVALLVDAPGELVAATFVVGLVTGIAEWRGMIRKSGDRFSPATNAKRLRGDHAQIRNGAR